MTRLQLRCFDFIRDRIERTGLAPSYPEIAAALGMKSRSSAHAAIQKLVRDRMLVKTGAGSRNLRLPDFNLVTVPTAALRAELERRDHQSSEGIEHGQ